ncbi:MAG: response regulator [Deltaproteobacteria bacterium]|nr:response regulator [Deltaproteobacteria bacterium]
MSKTLLVADDSATMRRVVEMTFAGEDVRVVGVPSGEAALAKARELHPDVVLADAVMTGMSGYDLCRAIKGDAGLRTTPVIVMASQHAPFDEALGRDVGADDHCIKPFETQALIDKVKAASARSSMAPTTKIPAAVPAPPPAIMSAPPPPIRPVAPASGPPRPAAIPAAILTPPPSPAVLTSDAPKPAPKTLPLMPAAEPTAATLDLAIDAVDRAAATALSKAQGLGLTPEQSAAVVKLTREVVERVVWEVVPDLAETLIKEEIQRLTKA